MEIATSRKRIKLLQQQLTSPRRVIENVLHRDLSWYDYEKLDQDPQLRYYLDIQKFFENTAIQNELKHFLGDLIEETAKSDAELNRDKPLRWSINGLETFVERLRSIQDPREKEPTKEDIHDVI